MAKRPRAQWAEKISAAWRSSVEAIFECGRLLIDAKEAKDKLPHGEFQKMINRDLPFGEGTAQRLMKIARDERLSKPAHGPLLPQSWRTLYELTFLDDEEFSTAIESGLINPDLMRSEAVELRRRWKEADESVPLRYPEQSDLPAITVSAPAAESVAPPQYRIRPSPANRIEKFTSDDFAEMSERHCAGQILEYLLALESESSGYDQERILEKLVGLLHDPTNGEKLERVRRGIGFAIRIKGALDQAGFRRGSSLRLID